MMQICYRARLCKIVIVCTKHLFLPEAVQLPQMGQSSALIGTMHCGVPTPMLAFPAPWHFLTTNWTRVLDTLLSHMRPPDLFLGGDFFVKQTARGTLESCANEVAFVATLRMNSVVVPARCAFIAQTFANEKSGSTTRLNVEEFDDASWQNSAE